MTTFLNTELLFVHPIIKAKDSLIESAQMIKQKVWGYSKFLSNGQKLVNLNFMLTNK